VAKNRGSEEVGFGDEAVGKVLLAAGSAVRSAIVEAAGMKR
jgi:hypothetical protein